MNSDGLCRIFPLVLGLYMCIYTVVPACTAEWYGSEHLGTSFGLLYLSQILSSVIVILLSVFEEDVSS